MSKFSNAVTGEELLGDWYIKLFEFPSGSTPSDFPEILRDFRKRVYVPVAYNLPSNIRYVPRDYSNRELPDVGSTLMILEEFGLAFDSNSQQWFLVAKSQGMTTLGKQLIDKDQTYSIGIAGYRTEQRVVHINFFTLDLDFSDTYQPLAISEYVPIEDWDK